MKWSDVGREVAKVAPLLGTFLAGAPGAVVGKLIAEVLDCEQIPENVLSAIKNTADATSKLCALELKHKDSLLNMTFNCDAQK